MQNKKLTVSLVASFFLATNLLSNELFISSATKSEQSIKDVTSNVEVITSDDIEERHFTSVVEALNSVSGISFTNNGGLGKTSNLYLRGNDNNKVLVLVDGVRFNNVTSTSGADFTNLSINNIQQIEIIKGAQSGIWGADAIAGVINIITKKPTKGFTGNVDMQYGSFNTKKLSTTLNYATDKFYIQGNLNKTNTDGFTAYAADNTSLNDYEDDGFESLEYGLSSKYFINDVNALSLSHRIIDNEVDLDAFGADNLDNKSTYKYHLSSLAYENTNNIASTKVFVNRSKFNWSYITAASQSDYDGSLSEYGIESTIPYLSQKSYITAGINYKRFSHENTLNKTYNNKAIFLTNSNSFNDGKTTITQSLRYDKFNEFKNEPTGKIGLKHQLFNDLVLSSNYGTAYNVPTLSNLFNPFWGNSNLNPEKSKSYDISAQYNGMKVTYFNNKIKNLIDYDFTTSKYINIDGTSTIKGYEFSYKKNILKDTFFNVNYTHLSAKDSNKEDLSRRPKNQIDFGFDYYGISKLHINLNGSYVGTRYNGTDKTGTQTGRYTVWNSVVNYDINKNLKTYLKIDNLFDKYYQTVDGYSTSPRAFYVGLKATF